MTETRSWVALAGGGQREGDWGIIKRHKGLVGVMDMSIIFVVNMHKNLSNCHSISVQFTVYQLKFRKAFLKSLYTHYEVDQGNLYYSSNSH